jgi:hypothetical protein
MCYADLRAWPYVDDLRPQRVMPTCIFILARLTLRVDNVLFRAHDTRIFHSYASNPPLIIRETSGWEAPYERVSKVRRHGSPPGPD